METPITRATAALKAYRSERDIYDKRMNWVNIGQMALAGILESEEINRVGALRLKWANNWWDVLDKVRFDLYKYVPKTQRETELRERLLAEVTHEQANI
jgi:hypothetical protein